MGLIIGRGRDTKDIYSYKRLILCGTQALGREAAVWLLRFYVVVSALF